MSSGPLIPDRQLTFSPDLAATIGLEEAVLLQGLGNRIPRDQGRWHSLVISGLERDYPFWQGAHIRTLLQRLADLGIIALLPGEDSKSIRIGIGVDATVTQRQKAPAVAPRAQPLRSKSDNMSASAPQANPWRPAEDLLGLLALNHGIERQFAMTQLSTFDTGADDHSRDSRFRQHVLSAWRRHQQDHSAFQVTAPAQFDNDWAPSADALEIMTRAEIDPEFIASLLPEFILYWRERGGPPKEVNSRFIGFIRQRWARFSAGLKHSTEPVPMTRNWQPHGNVYDILRLTGIEEDYARNLLAEFVLYWCDSHELHTSWNSKFLQHAKHQWRWQQGKESGNERQQAGGQTSASGRTRDRRLTDDLSDTNWAS